MTRVIDKFEGPVHGFLSNFYVSPIVLPDWHPAAGMTVPTIEHAFQSAKSADIAQARLIAACSSPGEAKRLGRRVMIRPDWDAGRDVIMLALLQIKFAPGTTLAGRLLDTEDAELVEGNTWGDTYWGVCNGVGQNRLGELLDLVRSRLAASQSPV
jgi:ribA/ribD-fused uncharacterized protein